MSPIWHIRNQINLYRSWSIINLGENCQIRHFWQSQKITFPIKVTISTTPLYCLVWHHHIKGNWLSVSYMLIWWGLLVSWRLLYHVVLHARISLTKVKYKVPIHHSIQPPDLRSSPLSWTMNIWYSVLRLSWKSCHQKFSHLKNELLKSHASKFLSCLPAKMHHPSIAIMALILLRYTKTWLKLDSIWANGP